MILLPFATSRRAFTLIELLMVMAVIAVLILLLLPVISMVRGSARTVVCLSNVRQLGFASISYTLDNRGRLPMSQWPDGPWKTRFWGVRLSSYMANFNVEAYTPGQRPPVPFACPESKLTNPTYEIGGDYSKNVFAGGYEYGHWLPPQPLAKYNAAETVGYADNSGGLGTDDIGTREFASWTGHNPEIWGLGFWRHRGKCSMVFLDGHVESRQKSQIQLVDYRLAPWGWPVP